MKKVAIIGLGLMGGSLGLALRSGRLPVRVSGYARRERTRSLALDRGVADEVHDSPERAVEGADMVVFCTPVLAIPGLVRVCKPFLAPGCVVTDVGSTKARLASELSGILRGCGRAFVGSHPIAGSEQTGIEAAKRDLYRGAVVFVTPGPRAPRRAVARTVAFWKTVGARPVVSDPLGHDRLIARTSHLPHLVAAMLVDSACRGRSAELKPFCGPGFRDTTRVAEGSPEMWHDIICTNRRAILGELRRFRGVVDRLASLVEAGDFKAVERFLDGARRRRQEALSPARRMGT